MELLKTIRELWHLEHDDVEAQWAKLLQEHFVDKETGDDLIFYVPTDLAASTGSGSRSKKDGELQVYRRGGTRKLPKVGSSDINWKESVCLNVLMQAVTYTLTTAVCKETKDKTLKPVQSTARELYASPSYRSMDVKGSGDVLTYPDLFFTVDDFDTFFEEYKLHPSQIFTLELMARIGDFETILLTGSIAHSSAESSEGLVAEYMAHARDRKKDGAYAWISRSQEDLVFFRIKAPPGYTGVAEMAVAVAPEDQATVRRATSPNSSTTTTATATTTSLVATNSSRRSSSNSSSSGSSSKGGLLSSLWQSATYRQLTQTVRSRLGLGYDLQVLKAVHFNTFVTYISLNWSDIMASLLGGPRVPRLAQLHERLQQRKQHHQHKHHPAKGQGQSGQAQKQQHGQQEKEGHGHGEASHRKQRKQQDPDKEYARKVAQLTRASSNTSTVSQDNSNNSSAGDMKKESASEEARHGSTTERRHGHMTEKSTPSAPGARW